MKFTILKVKSVILVFSILFFFGANAQFQNISLPHIRNYTTQDYNGQPDNFAAIEDNRGFLFFGNLWGILEYDGTEWRNIYFPNGSSGISFAKDNKGVIYCGGRGEFGFLEPDSFGFLKYNSLVHLLNKQIDFSDIWSTYFVDSSIVFCSYEFLFILKNNAISIVKPKTVYNRAFLVNGKLYVIEEGRGLCQLINNKLILTEGGDFYSHSSTSIILPYKEDKLVVANDKNFYIKDGHNSKPWKAELVDFLRDTKLFTAITLNDSSYVVATNAKGLIITDREGNIRNIFNKNSGLISNDILNIYCDSKGNIWVLTRGGISKIEINGCFNYINEYNGITGLNYSSCVFNNTLYLGTSNGLYHLSLSGTKNEINKKFKLINSTEGNTWNLHQFGDELFCGHNEGVFIIKDKNSRRIPGTNGVWCFLQPKGFKNIILAGAYQGIIVLERENKNWKMRGYLKGFNESSRFLVQDEMEDFWISHGNKGLFKLSLNHNLDSVLKIKSYGTSEGLYSSYNNTVYNFNKEIIVSNNQGFYKYNFKNDHFDPWKEFNEAIGNFKTIQRFVAESDNSFWVILNDEKIVHLTKEKQQFKTDISIRKFRKQLAGSFEHILPINKNLTLIATLEGYALFNKEKYDNYKALNKKLFKAYIRKIELTRGTFTTLNAGEFTNNGKNSFKEIKYKQNSIRFSFSSNYLEDIELLQFQVFLSGFDNSWSPWSTSCQKEYTNLPSGHYKFLVRAINSYDFISLEDSFEFIILPSWYKTNYAYFIYLILISLIFFNIYKFVLFRFKLQKKKLDFKKGIELRELNKKHSEEQIKKENEILKLTNEKLLVDIANLEQQELLRKKEEQLNEQIERTKQDQMQHEQEKHMLEITHKNKELSIMAMQIVHKNELIGKIREYLTKFNERNNSPDFKILTGHLFDYINMDIQNDKEWTEFQEYFKMVHSSFINKLKTSYPSISPALLKLCTYLRVKMSNKQIAKLMNTTVESVLKSRYRLREKLELGPEENLDDFIEKF